MKKCLVLIAVIAFLPLSFANTASQNAYDLFQKALAKERGEGNLEEAISHVSTELKAWQAIRDAGDLPETERLIDAAKRRANATMTLAKLRRALTNTREKKSTVGQNDSPE